MSTRKFVAIEAHQLAVGDRIRDWNDRTPAIVDFSKPTGPTVYVTLDSGHRMPIARTEKVQVLID